MASASLRGWSRSSSTAAKLAAVERIIGYQFKSLERLYEAMDQEKPMLTLPSGEERMGRRTRNTRLALVGDSAAQFQFACQWYEKDLDGLQWERIRNTCLSNENLGRIGFQMGLDELTVPTYCDGNYAMASTVEAILGAVHYDGGEDAVRRVMDRCRISHMLFDAPEHLWVRKAVVTSRDIPESFFSGHQWELQALLYRLNPKLLPRSTTGGIIRLPLHDARMKVEAQAAREEAREHMRIRAKEAAQRRLRETGEVENAEKTRAAAKAKKATKKRAGNWQPPQKTMFWDSMKRLWRGANTATGSDPLFDLTKATGSRIAAAQPKKATTGSRKAAKSDAAAGSNTVVASDTRVTNTSGGLLNESKGIGSYFYETFTKYWPGTQRPSEPSALPEPPAVSGSSKPSRSSGSSESLGLSGSSSPSETSKTFEAPQTPEAPEAPEAAKDEAPVSAKEAAPELAKKEAPVLVKEAAPEAPEESPAPELSEEAKPAEGVDMALDPKERKRELRVCRAKIKALKFQKKQHTAGSKKRNRRKGAPGREAYEAKLADIDERLEAARQDHRRLEQLKPKKEVAA